MKKWVFCDAPNDNYDEILCLEEDKLESDVRAVFNNEIDKEIVLCVGKVQSGKTNKIFHCIKHAFLNEGYDLAIIFGGTTYSLYSQTEERITDFLKANNINATYLDKERTKGREFVEGNKYIINVIKPSGVKDAVNFIKTLYKLDHRKVLIIDDESDYASVNTSKKDETATFDAIANLYKSFLKGKLLQVTATPFANIVSKKSSKLYADRIVCWTTPDRYCGISKFNSLSKEIYEIVDVDKNNRISLLKSIEKTVTYFLKEIINNFELFNSKEEVNCLFNVDVDIDTHIDVSKKVLLTLKNIKETRFKSFYEDNIDTELIDIQTYKERFDSIIKQLKIIPLNSKTSEKNLSKYNFIVGGTLISRGNTFKNLICELIINSPVTSSISVDTLLQRCRWFGYRENIISHMKIFMNHDIYMALLESEDYVKCLTVGEHTTESLYNKIKNLDEKSQYVKSTGKE